MFRLNFYLKSFAMIGVFLFVMGCGGGDDGEPDPIPRNEPRTAQDVIDDFNDLNISVGINDLTLESLVEGVYWDFRLIVPEGASSSNRRPMILRLHGAARGAGPNAHKSTECLFEKAFEGKDVFILSPNSKGNLWYEQPNILQIIALLDLTISNLEIDTEKVVVSGFSDGGNGSWFFSEYYPNIFSAAIPMATSYNTKPTSDPANKIDVPMYVIHGSEDTLFPIDITKGFVDASIEAGSDITFAVGEGLVHNDFCAYLSELEKAVVWLETEVW